MSAKQDTNLICVKVSTMNPLQYALPARPQLEGAFIRQLLFIKVLAFIQLIMLGSLGVQTQTPHPLKKVMGKPKQMALAILPILRLAKQNHHQQI